MRKIVDIENPDDYLNSGSEVDVALDFSEFNTVAVSEEWLKVALEITGDFETAGDPWRMVAGNFDGQGISCGILQWNIGQGSLQPKVKACGEAVIRRCMPVYGSQLWEACRKPITEGLRIVNSWQFIQNGKYKIREPILRELQELVGSREMIQQQVNSIKRVGQRAFDEAKRWAKDSRGAEQPSLREFCWFFDIITQNGGLEGLWVNDVRAFTARHSAQRVDDVICNEILNFPVYPTLRGHKDDAKENVALWRNNIPPDYLDLFVLSYLRTLKSKRQYWIVVMNRKGTIAFTRGYVNGSLENFSQLRNEQFLSSFEASDLPEKSLEIAGIIKSLEGSECDGNYECQSTIQLLSDPKSEVIVSTSSVSLQSLLETAFSNRLPVGLELAREAGKLEIRRITLLREKTEAAKEKIVFSIPVGIDGVNFEGGDAEDVLRWGPEGFRICPDYTFLITDSVTNRLLRFNLAGELVEIIEVKDATGITDAVMSRDGTFFVLDKAAMQPAILLLSADGEVKDKVSLTGDIPEIGLSGLFLDSQERILLEMFGGSEYRSLHNAEAEAVFSANENIKTIIDADYGDFTTDYGNFTGSSRGGVTIDDKLFAAVEVDNFLGSLNILHVTPRGEVFVLVEEVTSTPEISVDQSVHYFASDGSLIGKARVPISESYTFVQHNIAVAPDNQVYAMLTHPGGADIVRLTFVSALEPILAPIITDEIRIEREKGLASAALPQISRDQILRNAQAYIDCETELSEQNINGNCPGRIKPRYLGAPGRYKSVPYDWGGWDTIADFQRFMLQGRQAGDIVRTGQKTVENCSKGVDCSGFVTRCWGIESQKYGTATLPQISVEIPLSQIKPGDILNKVSDHVVIFAKFEMVNQRPVRVLTWEATMGNRNDRAVHAWWSWSRLASYTPRRYRGVSS